MRIPQPRATALVGIIGIAALGAMGLRRARAAGRARLSRYPARTSRLGHGHIAYIDTGPRQAPVILSLHGMFGGYDQGFDVAAAHTAGMRIIAPSRFGYPGSDIRGRGTPAEQVEALIELLDELGVERVLVMGSSAGGTAAIRFVLDHPERAKGLILFSSAPPLPERPARYSAFQGPPRLMHSDAVMLLLSPLFPLAMSMPPSTVISMLPIAERRAGALLDARITNPDMARHFEEYPIESLSVPVLILAAEDDRLVPAARMLTALHRFPDPQLLLVDDGGHLLAGHHEEVSRAIAALVEASGMEA